MTYIQCLKSSYQFKLTPSQRKLLDLLTQDYLSDVDMTAVHGSEEQDLVEAMVKCGLVNSLHLYLGVTGKELPFRPAMYAWKLPSETLLYIARHHPKIVQKTNPQNEMQSFTACVCYEPLDTDDFELRHKLEALVEAAEHTNIWEQVKTFGNLCDLCRVLAICGSGKTLKALGGWQSQDFSLQVLEIAIYEYYERNEKTSGFTSSKRFHDLERFQSLLKVANSTY